MRNRIESFFRGVKESVSLIATFLVLLGLLGGFFISNTGIALAEHTASVSVSPEGVDINQTTNLSFTVTKDTGDDLVGIKIDYSSSGFSDPESITCPDNWTETINTEEKYIKCVGLSDPISSGVVVLSNVSAPGTVGERNFQITTTDSNLDNSSNSMSVTVKNLSGTAVVNPQTTDINQSRAYNFTITNNGGENSDTIESFTISVPNSFTDVSVANPIGWVCSYTSPTITCTADSESELTNENSVSVNVTATAGNTAELTTWNMEITGSLGGVATPTNQPIITVQALPNIKEVSNTISPATVSQGQTDVSFSINVQNTGGVDVTLNDGSTISFTDGTNSYSVALSAETTIPAGQTATLTFVSSDISSSMANRSYNPTLTLSGTDANSASFSQTIDITSNSITVQIPAQLTIGEITSDVSYVSKNSADNNTATISIPVTNSGEATANIDNVIVQIFDQAATPNDISSDFTISRTDSTGNSVSGSGNTTLTYTVTPNSSESYEGAVNVKVAIDYKDANSQTTYSANNTVNSLFIIDNTSPTISSVSINPSSPTNNNAPTITFDVSDNGSGVKAGSVQISDGTNNYTPTCSGSSCSYTFTSPLSDETYNFVISASDNVGNQSSNDSLSNYVVDTVKPDTSDNYGDKDGKWQKEAQTITLTPSDQDPSSGIAWTKYCTDATNSCDPATDGTDYDESNKPTISTEGTTYFRYASKDKAGNVQDTVSREIKIDKIDPAIATITSPGDNSYASGTITIIANAEDNGDGSGIDKVEFYYYGTTTEGVTVETTKIGETSTPSGEEYSINWDTTQVEDGNYSLTAVAIDKAGNSLTSSAVSVTVDNTAPTIKTYTIDNPAISPNDDEVKDTTTIDLEFSEKVEADINILNSSNEVVRNLYHSDGVTNPDAKTWDGTDNGENDVVPDGTYTIQVVITDKAGNSTIDTSKTIVVDTQDPTIDAGSDVTANDQFTQNATASDDNSGIASYQWEQASGPGTITFGTPNKKSTKIKASADGIYTIKLTVTDNAGNNASDTMQLIWDTQSPTISDFVAPATNKVYKSTDGSIPLQFTPDGTGSAVSCSYKIDSGDSVLVDCQSGAEASTTISGLSDGRHSLTITVTDAAGNSKTSDSVSFVVDTNNTLTVGQTGNPDFTSIQDAINAASNDDTIEVAAGTYNENITIPDNKTGLTISGESGATISLSSGNGITIGSTNSSTTIEGFTITGAVYGIDVEGANNVVIQNNTIINYSEEGIWINGGKVNVVGNTITGSESGSYSVDSIYIKGNAAVSVTNNELSENKYSGNAYNQDIDDWSTAAGLSIHDTSNVTATGNYIHDNDFGVHIKGVESGDNATVTVEENKIVNNRQSFFFEYRGVKPSSDFNATKNWWGTAVTSTIADGISCSGNLNPCPINYQPYYVNEGMTILSNVAPDAVYVDSTYSDNNTGDHIFGYNAFATIQEGINAVATSGVVSIAAGTYQENITIDKSLTLQGEASSTTTIESAGGNAVTINNDVDGVKIEGFTITGADIGIYTAGGTDDEHIVIQNNVINNYSTEGIKVYGGHADILGNIIEADSDGTPKSHSVDSIYTREGANVTIIGNILRNNKYSGDAYDKSRNDWSVAAGISAHSYDNLGDTITASDNEIYNNDFGIHGKSGDTANPTIIAHHNKVYNNGYYGFFYEAAGNTTSNLDFDGTNNWWGSATGPFSTSTNADPNIGGQGNAVSDYVSYRPWCSDESCSTEDNIKPTVVGGTPVPDSYEVNPSTDIEVTFSESVQCSNGEWENCISVVGNDEMISGTANYNDTDHILTFTPSKILDSNMKYAITLNGVIDMSGNKLTLSSPYSNWTFTTATYYDISLHSGWNLISIPTVPDDTSVNAVLDGAASAINSVWSYDAETGHWYVAHPNSDAPGDLTDMTAGYGYWINSTENTEIKGFGSYIGIGGETPSVPQSRTLYPGWNLVGYYELSGQNPVSTLEEAFGDLSSCRLYKYDNENRIFLPKSKISEVYPGDAFWILVQEEREY